MFIKTLEPWGIVEIYPFVEGELSTANFMSGPRIEVFPRGFEDGLNSENRVRLGQSVYSREQWAEYITKLNAGMEEAFDIDDENERKRSTSSGS